MFFGPKSFKHPRQGLPRSVKVQLCAQLFLLAFVCGLLFVVARNLGRGGGTAFERGAPQPPGEAASGAVAPGTSGAGEGPAGAGGRAAPEGEGPAGLELEAEEALLGEVVQLEPPQEFVERPEVLFDAAACDKTAEICESAVVHFFHRIRTLPEPLALAEPVLSYRRGDPVWEAVSSNPGRYRGKLVEIRGSLVSESRGEPPLRIKGLPYPNPSGVDRAFQSYVIDDRGFFLVYTIEGADLSHLDGVTFRGYFLQLYTNQSLVKGRLVPGTIPFLVGEGYRPLAMPATRSHDIRPFLPYALVLPVVAAGVIGFLSYRSRKSYEARRAAARERDRGGRGGDGSPPPPSG